MKKLFLLSPFLCFLVLFLFSACGIKPEELVKNNLAEVHFNYFVGETQNFSIALWSGLREQPYNIDGIKQDSVEFCVISVVPKTNISTFGLGYTAEINNKTYNGEFENSPFDSSLATDLEIKINADDTIFIYLIADGETEIGKMECISKDFKINQTQALEIAINDLSEDVLKLTDNGKDSIEVYCKIISTDKNLGIYFWFVNIVSANNQVSVVIDTTTGEIIAKK